MADDGYTLVGAFGQDCFESAFDSLAKILCGFGFGNGASFQFVEPFERAAVVFAGHVVPTQAGPDTEIDFSQSRKNRRFVPGHFEERNHRLANALHGAGVNGVEREAGKVLGQRAHLLVAERGELHIDLSAENAVIFLLHFPMTDEEEANG